MGKCLRRGLKIFLAPGIEGWYDDNGHIVIEDKEKNKSLNHTDRRDIIDIYERQINGWFLDPATKLVNSKNRFNNSQIVLMICMSYFEGVEQHRNGTSSNSKSENFFVRAMNRIYQTISHNDLKILYRECRCGLFHDGMTRGVVIFSYDFKKSLEFTNPGININPKKLLNDIIKDFQIFLKELRTDNDSWKRFNDIYSFYRPESIESAASTQNT